MPGIRGEIRYPNLLNCYYTCIDPVQYLYRMANQTSPHILSTSANLLGFCLFVITSLHITNGAEASYVDEITSYVAILLICSCFFSFTSIKTLNPKREALLESIADYLFLISLSGILIVIVLITLNLLK